MGYCERCGGKYDFEGICETCGEDEEWSWNKPHNQNKVVCKGCGHEIYEVRRYCHICGTKNEAAFKKGENYCPRCGLSFVDGVCPNCGKPSSHFLNREFKPEEKKYCSVCKSEVSGNDHFCMYCGSETYLIHPSKIYETAKYYPKEPSRSVPKKNASAGHTIREIEAELKSTTSVLWTVLGLLQAILFCMPTGFVTVFYSIKTTEWIKRGRFRRAKEKLRNAKIWFFVGLGIDVLLLLAFAVVMIFRLIAAN